MKFDLSRTFAGAIAGFSMLTTQAIANDGPSEQEQMLQLLEEKGNAGFVEHIIDELEAGNRLFSLEAVNEFMQDRPVLRTLLRCADASYLHRKRHVSELSLLRECGPGA